MSKKNIFYIGISLLTFAYIIWAQFFETKVQGLAQADLNRIDSVKSLSECDRIEVKSAVVSGKTINMKFCFLGDLAVNIESLDID